MRKRDYFYMVQPNAYQRRTLNFLLGVSLGCFSEYWEGLVKKNYFLRKVGTNATWKKLSDENATSHYCWTLTGRRNIVTALETRPWSDHTTWQSVCQYRRVLEEKNEGSLYELWISRKALFCVYEQTKSTGRVFFSSKRNCLSDGATTKPLLSWISFLYFNIFFCAEKNPFTVSLGFQISRQVYFQSLTERFEILTKFFPHESFWRPKKISTGLKSNRRPDIIAY